CTYPVIEGKTYRTRTPKSIADEMEAVHKRLGFLTFEFVDSTFNDPPGHAEEICREIAKRNLNVQLRTMGINPAHATKELFDLMLAAGFSGWFTKPVSLQNIAATVRTVLDNL
ncbi:MAG: hypothetical protein KKH60_05330, partial [Proteobacteria bacterium]|nr:hypothetical protein [Pseudomonadota bacterium]